VRDDALGLQIEARLKCDRDGCRRSSPLSFWFLEGKVAELAAASGAALETLDKLDAARRKRLEARLRQANEDLSTYLTDEAECSAADFLAVWVAGHVQAHSEVSQLLADLLSAWAGSDLTGTELLRAAGGDLVRFLEDAVRRTA
jgi:hypothetical protein